MKRFALLLASLAVISSTSCSAGIYELLKLLQKLQTSSENEEVIHEEEPEFENRFAGKPIPCGPDAFCDRDYDINTANWHRSCLRTAYKEHGVHDPSWDEDVHAFLDKLALRLASDKSDTLLNQLYDEAGFLIEEKKCIDPLIVYYYGNLTQNVYGDKQAAPILEASIDALADRDYPAHLQYYALKRLSGILIKTKRRSEGKDMKEHALFELARASADKCFQDNSQRYYTNEFFHRFDEWKHDERILFIEYFNEVENPDPWIKEIVLGNHAIKLAWKSRGGGWASTVSDEGWKGFQEYSEEAREHFTKAYELHPEFPDAASMMIKVRMGSKGPVSFREWFDRAVAAKLDHIPAYHKLRWAMRPRWHGSHKELLMFGKECVETNRFDTWVPYQYTWILDDIREDRKSFGDLFLDADVFDTTKKCFEGYLAEKSKEADWNFMKNQYALVHFFAGKYDRAKELFDQCTYEEEAFSRWELNKEEIFGKLALLTGPDKKQFQAALEDMENGNDSKALETFIKISEDETRTLNCREYARRRLKDFTFTISNEDNEKLLDYLIRSEHTERVLRLYGAAVQHNIELSPEFTLKVRTFLGDVAFHYAFVVPEGTRYLEKEEFQEKVAELDELHKKLSEQNIGTEEERHSHRYLAEFRYAIVTKGNYKARLKKELVPTARKIKYYGWILEVLRYAYDEPTFYSQDYFVRRIKIRTYVVKAMKAEQNTDRINEQFKPLETLTDPQELTAACRENFLKNGNLHVALRTCLLLREKGMPQKAQAYEDMVNDYFFELHKSNSYDKAWAPWYAAWVYNFEWGFEDKVVHFGKMGMTRKNPYDACRFMATQALLRQNKYDEAFELFMKKNPERKDDDAITTAEGTFTYNEYIRFLAEKFLEASEQDPDIAEQLHDRYPDIMEMETAAAE